MLRRIPTASAHITYAFLGEVPDALAGDVHGAVECAAASHGALPIVLGPPHVLYAGRVARLVCADITSGGVEVRRLADDIVEQLGRACPGVTASPMKAPHVALARFRRGVKRSDAQASRLLADGGLASVSREDRVARVQVVSSQLASGGPVYETRSEVLLAP